MRELDLIYGEYREARRRRLWLRRSALGGLAAVALVVGADLVVRGHLHRLQARQRSAVQAIARYQALQDQVVSAEAEAARLEREREQLRALRNRDLPGHFLGLLSRAVGTAPLWIDHLRYRTDTGNGKTPRKGREVSAPPAAEIVIDGATESYPALTGFVDRLAEAGAEDARILQARVERGKGAVVNFRVSVRYGGPSWTP